MFHVGQKVVCVDDSPRGHSDWFIHDHPTKGRIYIIRWAGLSSEGYSSVRLQGIFGGMRTKGDEYKFMADRFRPVIERKTGIGLLTALLNPANHRKLTDA